MLKRIIAALLIVLLALSFGCGTNEAEVSATPEPTMEPEKLKFTFRNGIQFGDSKEDVMAKDAMSPEEKERMDWFEYERDEQKCEIARAVDLGQDKTAQLRYCFDNDKLIDAEYRIGNAYASFSYIAKRSLHGDIDDFTGPQNRNQFELTYQDYYDLLVEKYGAPIENPFGKTFVITGKAFEDVTSNEHYSIVKYDEWLVECDGDYYLKVDMAWGENLDSDYYGKLLISYHYVSNDECAEALAGKIIENETLKGAF